ncbi:hypothetical protein HOC96_06955 [archaeon]|jgi:hypothetical protein|nr:hypothetical protein [archaeon]
MVSGDHFICGSCDYEWRTRKDVGEPSTCPHCKKNHISNESEKSRIARDKLRRAEEKKKEKEQADYQKELLKLKSESKFLYFLVYCRWILFVFGVFTLILNWIGVILLILASVGLIKNDALKKGTSLV